MSTNNFRTFASSETFRKWANNLSTSILVAIRQKTTSGIEEGSCISLLVCTWLNSVPSENRKAYFDTLCKCAYELFPEIKQ